MGPVVVHIVARLIAWSAWKPKPGWWDCGDSFYSKSSIKDSTPLHCAALTLSNQIEESGSRIHTHVLSAHGLIISLQKCLLYCSQCTKCSCLSNNHSALYSCIIDTKLLKVSYVYLIAERFFPSKHGPSYSDVSWSIEYFYCSCNVYIINWYGW